MKEMSKKRLCSIPGCKNVYLARGWCGTHYARWHKYGDPHGGGRDYKSTEESFRARTRWQHGCLQWIGGKQKHGYGSIWWRGKMRLAHRYAWFRAHGEIPDGSHIDHVCHNPSCVNVQHLRLATPAQNASHMKGTQAGTESGVRNVTRKRNKWSVRVIKDGTTHRFGVFDTIEEAAQVAEQARRELFGEFAGKA